jgi:hypothetical protein
MEAEIKRRKFEEEIENLKAKPDAPEEPSRVKLRLASQSQKNEQERIALYLTRLR